MKENKLGIVKYLIMLGCCFMLATIGILASTGGSASTNAKLDTYSNTSNTVSYNDQSVYLYAQIEVQNDTTIIGTGSYYVRNITNQYYSIKGADVVVTNVTNGRHFSGAVTISYLGTAKKTGTCEVDVKY